MKERPGRSGTELRRQRKRDEDDGDTREQSHIFGQKETGSMPTIRRRTHDVFPTDQKTLSTEAHPQDRGLNRRRI